MRHSRLSTFLAVVFCLGLVVSAQADPNVYQWWMNEFGTDASWDTEAEWVQNYVLNSSGDLWRANGYYDPDSDPNYDLTSYFWHDGWDSKTLQLKVEYAGWRNRNTFGYYQGSTRYELFNGPAGAGATASMTAPDGTFGFYADSSANGKRGGLWYTDASINAPVFDSDSEPDNSSTELTSPFMQAVVMKHPTATWEGWIIAWADADLSQGEHMFGGSWAVSEPDYNDMIVSIERTPELPPSALLMVGSLPLGMAYIRGRRRRES